MEKVSVIMSVYNEQGNMLRESIESIRLQTYNEIEFIIVIDNPKNDEAIEILSRYAALDKRIILLKNEQNIGLALSLNKALEYVTGEYVARMDADDISLPNRIECEVDYLRKNSLDMVFSDRADIDEHGNLIEEKRLHVYSTEVIEHLLSYRCIVNHPSVLIKADVIKGMLGYRNFRASQDYDLWLRLLTSDFVIGCIPEVLLKYRIRGESISKGKRFIQFETARYIRKLYCERKRKGEDSYSEESYEAFLTRKGVFNSRKQSRFDTSMKCYEKAMLYRRSGNKKEFLLYFIRSLIGIEWVGEIIYLTLKEKSGI